MMTADSRGLRGLVSYADELFFNVIRQTSVPSAEAVMPFVIKLTEPASVVDVGGSIGAWLKPVLDRNIDGLCIDNLDYTDGFLIPQRNFMKADLTQDSVTALIHKKYDLAISLENLEHLPETDACNTVMQLCSIADCVLFSAAIPQQGGRNHINEQWLTYWEAVFNKYDFVLHDVIRPVFWDNTDVAMWYRQNCVLFAKSGSRADGKLQQSGLETVPKSMRNIVHPELFLSYRKVKRKRRKGLAKIAEKIKRFCRRLLGQRTNGNV